jgi:hypothetical protein
LANRYLVVNAWSFAAIPFLLLKVQAKGMSSTNSAGVMVLADQYKKVNLRLTRGEASGLVVTCGWNAGAAKFCLIIGCRRLLNCHHDYNLICFELQQRIAYTIKQEKMSSLIIHEERKLVTPWTGSSGSLKVLCSH